MRKKIIITLAVLVLLAVSSFATVACSQAIEPEAASIIFGYRPISPSLDFFVAIDKGYFKKENLNVELKVFRGSSDLTDAVMAGKVDFASDLGMVTQLLPALRTGKYKVKFLTLDLDALDAPMRGPTLVAKKNIGISGIEDLKGKNIGIFPGVNFKIFLEALLKKHGLDIDSDVEVTQIPPQEQIAAFASVDALLSLDPITNGVEAKYGAFPLSDRISARYIFDNFPAAASSVNAEFAKQHPGIVKRVNRALSRGIDFVRNNPDQTAEILAKWTKLPLEITKKMNPVKYAKHDEIDIYGLQRACDYLTNIPWLNLKQHINASQLVWDYK